MAICEIGVSFPDQTFGKESRFGVPFTVSSYTRYTHSRREREREREIVYIYKIFKQITASLILVSFERYTTI